MPDPLWGFEALIEYLRSLGASDEVINYLANFTDEQDLANRIRQLGLPQTDTEDIYNNLLSFETDYTKQRRKQYGTDLETQRQQEATQTQKRQYQEAEANMYRQQAVSDIWNSPYLTDEDRGYYGRVPEDQFIQRMGTVIDERARAAGQPTRAEQAQSAPFAGSQYRNEGNAYLRAFNNPPSMSQAQTGKVMPSIESVVNPTVSKFEQGMEYGKGTRLRNFLEQEMAGEIPNAVKASYQARQEWWNALNAPSVGGYEGTLGSLQEQAGHYGAMAANAPTQAYYGGAYYGEGGIAGIAQQALEQVQNNMAGLDRGALDDEAYGIEYARRAAERGGDPLKKALDEALNRVQAGYKPKYYRQAGTGMAGRLQPSVRFR